MSTFTATRADIAARLSTVPGVKGYTKRPTVWSPGDALVLVERIDHTLGVVWQPTWRIILMLSGDEGVAIDQLDTLFPAVCEAIQPVVYADSATPELIPTEGGPMTAVVIIARSE